MRTGTMKRRRVGALVTASVAALSMSVAPAVIAPASAGAVPVQQA